MSATDSAVVHATDLAPDRLRARLAELGPVPDRSSVPVVRAPGRVNLIGEHTDYNLGYVLPAAIDLEVWIAFVPARDRHVELVSDVTGERACFDLDAISPSAGGMAAYVRLTSPLTSRPSRRRLGPRGDRSGTWPGPSS